MLENLKTRLGLSFLPSKKTTLAASESTDKKAKSGSVRLKLHRQYQYRVALELRQWQYALAAAEHPTQPRRQTLYALYREAMKDDHLFAQWRLGLIALRRSPFAVERAGETDATLKALFETVWFKQWIQAAYDTEFWGHSLVEFSPERNDNGEFRACSVIPREHVVPETQQILLRLTDTEGISYHDTQKFPLLLEIGERDDLGILRIATRNVIRKQYSLEDWSLRNEKFGMPLSALRTASRHPKDLDAKEEMLRNLGANGFVLLDAEDEITFHEPKQAMAYQTYQDLVTLSERGISKVVNGQSSVTDEKAFVGTAQVQERILNDYTFERLDRLEVLINQQLIPFLCRHGYPSTLKTAKFRFLELQKM
jgi:Protein of unknown function (DUF935)